LYLDLPALESPRSTCSRDPPCIGSGCCPPDLAAVHQTWPTSTGFHRIEPAGRRTSSVGEASLQDLWGPAMATCRLGARPHMPGEGPRATTYIEGGRRVLRREAGLERSGEGAAWRGVARRQAGPREVWRGSSGCCSGLGAMRAGEKRKGS
jgi:hypothetical protein